MKPLATLFFATLTISSVLAESPTLVVDSTFQKADADGRPLTATAPFDSGELPLRMPTTVDESPGSASSPSQARVGKEVFGLLKPPYLILQTGEDSKEPGAIADVGVFWDLQKLALSEGRYEVSFDTAASQTDKTGGAFQIVFRSQAPNFLATVNPASRIGTVWFMKNGQMLVAGAGKGGEGPALIPYQADELYHCVMRIDLDKRVWSCVINGEPLVEAQKMPDFLQEDATGPLSLSGIAFSSRRGMMAQPDARFLLANVKVIKLAN